MFFAQERRTAQTAVAADDDESFDALCLELLIRLCTTFRRHETMAASRAEERAAALNDVADILSFHLEHLTVQDAAIPVMYTPHFCTFKERRAHDGASRRIHAGAVAAARQDADTIQHRKIPPIPMTKKPRFLNQSETFSTSYHIRARK